MQSKCDFIIGFELRSVLADGAFDEGIKLLGLKMFNGDFEGDVFENLVGLNITPCKGIRLLVLQKLLNLLIFIGIS